MTVTTPLLTVRDLAVHFSNYEGRHRVLDGVNLRVNEGETVALVGETGCGKSVTASTIMGTLGRPPGEIVNGTVTYRGTELLSNPETHEEYQSERMSMIFQDPMSHLSPVFTIGEIMGDVMDHSGDDLSWWDVVKNILGKRSDAREAERRGECVEIFSRLRIPDPEGIIDRYPMELSGGMRQRVLIALAMLNDPEFLIADEPTTALDVTVQEQIIDLLRDRIVGEDLSMLYITHNLGVAREIADRIYVMYAGTIAESGPTETLFDSPLHPYTRGLIASIPKLTSFEGSGIPGSIPDYTDPPTGCRFADRCPASMDGICDVEPPETVTVDDHALHCYLYEDGMPLEEARSIAAEEIDYPSMNNDEARKAQIEEEVADEG